MAALAILAGCAKEMNNTPEEEDFIERTFTATFDGDVPEDLADDEIAIGGLPETKTAIYSDGTVNWRTYDTIKYYTTNNGAISKCVIGLRTGNTLNIRMSTSAEFLVAIYGASGFLDNYASYAWVNAINETQDGTFENNHLAAVKTTDLTTSHLSFCNLTSFFKFTLTRTDVEKIIFRSNDGTLLHRYGTAYISFLEQTPSLRTLPGGGSSITINHSGAGDVFVATRPCNLAKGFSIDLYDKDDKYLGTAKYDKSVTLERNRIKDLGTIDSHVEQSQTSLSDSGYANCYIVSDAGPYKFSVNKYGNSSAIILTPPASCEVLWESFGTSTKPSVGDLMNCVALSGSTISFNATGRKGNAVIAVKNASGTILWSWHIWFTDKPEDQVYNNGAGTMMDRNLGATSATAGDVGALGLFYQWGRKDPFLGGATIDNSYSKASSTIVWPAYVEVSTAVGTGTNSLSYTKAHPTTFIDGYNTGGYYNWYCTDSANENTKLWSSTKTMYDPCPAGYRVPDENLTSGIWSKALNWHTYSIWYTSTDWDSTNMGMDYAKTSKTLGSASSIWYPGTGYLSQDDGTLLNLGQYGCYWSSTVNTDFGGPNILGVNKGGYTYFTTKTFDSGCAVRCMKE